MFAEEIVVRQAAAKVVIVPFRFALRPRLGWRTESHPLGAPLGGRIGQDVFRALAVLLHQRFELDAGGEIAVEEVQRPAFARLQLDVALQKQCGTGIQRPIERTIRSARVDGATGAKKRLCVRRPTAGRTA